ncbi:MAG TPA: hypothetical protein VGU20_04240 [Stellaceae bacterium]|nr:hypothetical protein [Stellaceae bacterium]
MSNTKQPSTALVIYDEAEHGRLGPAMRALNSDKQRAFVIALIHTGCTTARAAQLAGYSDASQNTLAAKGWQLSHDPKVQAALHEEGIKALRASGVAAIGVLDGIMRNPQEAARDRIAAGKELLGRGGFAAVTEHNVNVTHRSESEIDAELLAVAKELGMSDEATAKLLGRPVARKRGDNAIDVTDVVIIEEISEPAPATAPIEEREAEDISDLF